MIVCIYSIYIYLFIYIYNLTKPFSKIKSKTDKASTYAGLAEAQG